MITLDDMIFALIYCMICQVDIHIKQQYVCMPVADFLQTKIFPSKEAEPAKQPENPKTEPIKNLKKPVPVKEIKLTARKPEKEEEKSLFE